MPGQPKRYKDFRFYGFISLHFIAGDLDISIYQTDLRAKLAPILAAQTGVSKSSIMYEIRSNHTMVNKVLGYLEAEGLIVVETVGSEYRIKITEAGVLYLREYSRFYRELFKSEIAALYRFSQSPGWVRD